MLMGVLKMMLKAWRSRMDNELNLLTARTKAVPYEHGHETFGVHKRWENASSVELLSAS
jgi:hypothetical protein